MTISSRNRWLTTLLLAALIMGSALAATPAHAAGGYGELLRFRGKGTAKSPAGGELELAGKETDAFAVDPESGEVYAGDEKEEGSSELRIQRYGSGGAFEASALIKEAKLPKGLQGIEGYEGFAVADGEKRVYALAVDQRFAEDAVDGGVAAAGALYAFDTTASGTSLEPAPGAAKSTGLLGTLESLGANSETQGKALLDPAGLAVDPQNGEVLILGIIDEGAGGKHLAVQHVSPSGTLGVRYVDPEETSFADEPDSPVVSPGGRLFFESGDELLTIPASATTGAPQVAFQFAQPPTLQVGPFSGELLSFGEGETGSGAALSIIPEGTGTGRLVAFAEIHEATNAGELEEIRNGAVTLDYAEEGERLTVSEQGWTGGVPGEGEEEASERKEKVKPCEIGFAGANPAVAAAPDGDLYVLSPAWSEVIKFGPGGTGCPTAHEAPGGLEATLAGKPVTNPEITDKVTLTAKVVQADVLSVKWVFGDGQETTVQTPAGEQIQEAEVAHKFSRAGKLQVEALIHTDNLATPEVVVKGTVNVVENTKGAPHITLSPTSQSVVEGESAVFKAAASGEPTPAVQWEASKDGGSEWSAVTGATSTTLTLPDVTTADNGWQYRATFQNGVGSPATTGAATLTVSEDTRDEPHVTSQPAGQSVVEGESAVFTAAATGEPTPGVQWEVSEDGGTDWAAVAGATSTTLTLTGVTTAESGRQYRATFENHVGKPATTDAATLTVESRAEREEREARKKQEEEALRQREEEARRKSEEEARSREAEARSREAEAAQRAGEEAAQRKREQEAAQRAAEEAVKGSQGVLGTHEASPRATLASSTLAVSGGSASAKVSCPAGVATCSGTVTLRTLTAVSAGAHAARKAILTLGSASFTVAGGQTRTVTVRLSSAARRLLARSHTLRARVTVVAHDPSGAGSTVASTVVLHAGRK